MNWKQILGGAVLAAFLALTGCSAKEGGDRAKAATAGKPPVAVDVAEVSAGDVTEGIEIVGTLSAKYRAEIKSEYGGVVSHVYVSDWARVRAGDPLLKVDTREGEVLLQKAEAALGMAKAVLLEAEAAGGRADREYERTVRLHESGLVTRQAMEDARTQKDAAAARIAAAKAQVAAAGEDVFHAKTRLSKATIRAPLDGTVEERLVNAGDLVGEMQKVVFRIVDNRLLELTASVPSTEMGGVRVGSPLVFTTDAFPGREFTGTVAHVNPSVNPGDRSVRVTAQIRNVPEVLKGGLFVKGRIVTGARKGVLRIPRSALFAQDIAKRRADVFVIDGGFARRRTVAAGVVDGEFVEISSGIARGERVVTRGAFLLKDGDAVRVAASPAR